LTLSKWERVRTRSRSVSVRHWYNTVPIPIINSRYNIEDDLLKLGISIAYYVSKICCHGNAYSTTTLMMYILTWYITCFTWAFIRYFITIIMLCGSSSHKMWSGGAVHIIISRSGGWIIYIGMLFSNIQMIFINCRVYVIL